MYSTAVFASFPIRPVTVRNNKEQQQQQQQHDRNHDHSPMAGHVVSIDFTR
jgi:hypothetical protein